MEISKFTMGIVGLVVIVLLITSVVLPTVENAQDQQTTAYNNEDYTFRVLDTTEADLTIRWLSTTSYSINDVVYEQVSSGRILISDNVVVTFATNNLQVKDYSASGESGYNLDTSSSAGTDQTVTVSNGVLTTNAEKTCNVVGDVLVRTNDTKATYGVFAYSDPCVVDYDSIVHSVVTVTLNEKSYALILSGKYNALSVKSAYCVTDSAVVDATKFTIAFKSTSIGDDHEISIGLRNYTFEVTLTDSGQTYSTTNTSFVYAPIEYHMIDDTDSQVRALLGIIPLLLIIVAVLFAVRLMGTSRN